MTETLAPATPNQYFAPGDPVAAEAVFDGVYRAFANDIGRLPAERTRLINGVETVVATNYAAEFMNPRFEQAANTVAPLDRPIKASAFDAKFINEVTTEAHAVYAAHPEHIPGRIARATEVVNSFMNRAKSMHRDGAADSLTIKLFLDRIEGFKYNLSNGHNAVTAKNDERMPNSETIHRYTNTVHRLFSGKDDAHDQDSGPFLHINSQRYLASGIPSTERYYISPKLNGQPEEAVRIWTTTLADMGLDEKLYYKVAQGTALRYDTVVAYASSETASEMEAAVQEFARRCPPELLSDSPMPAGIEVAKGIARTPEPTQLNTLLRYRGKKILSYNEYACALTELALRRASYDFIKQGVPANQVKPKDLAVAAKPYFLQFVALSGIDPATMQALPAS